MFRHYVDNLKALGYVSLVEADKFRVDPRVIQLAEKSNRLLSPDLRESIQHEVDGTIGHLEAIIGSKSDIAEYQEFGTEKIPPRPFIGPAAFNQKDKIQQLLGEAFVEGLVGGESIHRSLGYDFET